jgi:hypothetical protein
MSGGIYILDRIVASVAIAIEIGWVVRIRYNAVRLAPPVKISVIIFKL